MKIAIISILFLSLNLFAKPSNFYSGQKKAVFVNFIKAHSEIVYDLENKENYALTTIEFFQDEEGYPLFDLVQNVDYAIINGKNSEAFDIFTPNQETILKLLNTKLKEGYHTLILKNKIRTNVVYNIKGTGLQSGFFTSDLDDRSYLEKYLPTNLEYDQYEITFDVRVIGTNVNHVLYTNGTVIEIAKNHFTVKYPLFFQSSSLFFHLVDENRFPEEKFSYRSLDGRIIPITLYTRSEGQLSSFKKKILITLENLEQELGSWPHEGLIVFGSGMGGMEYCGATVSDLMSLSHELIHSYFARGVMPQNGNAGWIDEAITSWLDDGMPMKKKLTFKKSGMASHSEFTRTTDKQAYTKGKDFISYLNFRLKNMGGLKPFLVRLLEEKKFQNIRTEDFLEFLNLNTGIDFTSDFLELVY